jgi:hypothetical protein
MLDPLVEGWAKEAGLDPAKFTGGQLFSSMLGSNILGGIVTIPLDVFLTELGGKIASFFIGGLSLALGYYTFRGQSRIQLDTLQFGSRMVTEILDPNPEQVKAIQKSIGDAVDGWVQGRWDKVLYAFVRNPRELTGMVTGIPPAPEKPAEKIPQPPAATGQCPQASEQKSEAPPTFSIRLA